MSDDSHEYRTTHTPLAAYLVSEGFDLLTIEYDQSEKGTYVFNNHDCKLREFVSQFNRGDAVGNIAMYEHAKGELLNRVKHGLP